MCDEAPVDALVVRLQERISRLEAWLEGDCQCPCCDEIRECLDECTFVDDAPQEADRMAAVRGVFFGA